MASVQSQRQAWWGNPEGDLLWVQQKIPTINGRCLVPTINGCCLVPTINGCCLVPMINGCCLVPTINGRCMVPTINGHCYSIGYTLWHHSLIHRLISSVHEKEPMVEANDIAVQWHSHSPALAAFSLSSQNVPTWWCKSSPWSCASMRTNMSVAHWSCSLILANQMWTLPTVIQAHDVTVFTKWYKICANI